MWAYVNLVAVASVEAGCVSLAVEDGREHAGGLADVAALSVAPSQPHGEGERSAIAYQVGALLPLVIRNVGYIPRLSGNLKIVLANHSQGDSSRFLIRAGFLGRESRKNLMELARDGLAAHRFARRANALLLLDDGISCTVIAQMLLLHDDTVRG